MSTTESTAIGEFTQRARHLVATELKTYAERTVKSQAATERARRSLPLGVPSSFQAYDPYPVVAARASGSRIEDVDGNRYLDFLMGFGALFAGHVHPRLKETLEAQLDLGTLFVTPCEGNAEVAELLAARFGQPLWRFTNSGTESTMDAIRVARAHTGRDKIVKVEGGYHGHHDEVMVSMKPPLDVAGPADAPIAVPATLGIAHGVLADVIVVPFNDPDALERALRDEDVAAFIVEPVMQNIGICLPDTGYLAAAREITERYGTLLIFDEVKTGITAGWSGATGFFGVQPDLVALAKSIGGGLPVGAFGGRAAVMQGITSGRVLHLGTYNGNPLVMAAAKTVLTDICTPDATDEAIARNRRFLDTCDALLAASPLPAHTVQFGAKGCITFSDAPVRNYRDYKATDFDLAYASWLWCSNRGVLLPPGLDDQWLVSVLHTDADIAHAIDVISGFVDAVTNGS
jgi:glutamate-1-semialdehyde 2,1-aminomutase